MTDADMPGTLVPSEQPREEAWLRGLSRLFDQILHRDRRQRVSLLFPVKGYGQPLNLFR